MLHFVHTAGHSINFSANSIHMSVSFYEVIFINTPSELAFLNFQIGKKLTAAQFEGT